jgi:hypothetical protein
MIVVATGGMGRMGDEFNSPGRPAPVLTSDQ